MIEAETKIAEGFIGALLGGAVIAAFLMTSGCGGSGELYTIRSVDTYKEGLYLDTDRGMFRVCDSKDHSKGFLQDRIVLKHNALVDRKPKKLEFCRGHDSVISVEFAEDLPVNQEAKTSRPIVYQEVTPEGIHLSALVSTFAGFAGLTVALLLAILGGYRIGKAGRR